MDASDPRSLRRYSLFAGIFDPQLRAIGERLSEQRFAAGEALLVEGGQGDAILLVVAGRVEVRKRSAGGGERRLAELGPGATVGEMELLDLQPRSCSVVALEPVEALSLTRADLLALQRDSLEAFAALALNLARDLSRRLRRMDALLAEAIFTSP